MATKLRVLTLILWVVTVACFAAGMLGGNRVASAVGLSTFLLYMVVAARARSFRSDSTRTR